MTAQPADAGTTAERPEARQPDVVETDPAMTDALARLGPKGFMREVAKLCPIDLDKPEDAEAYVGYLEGRWSMRVLCAAETRDPIGGWEACALPWHHEGEHDSGEYAWGDEEDRCGD